ncbi:hypothetical protein D9M71_643710 [compost metagenome]
MILPIQLKFGQKVDTVGDDITLVELEIAIVGSGGVGNSPITPIDPVTQVVAQRIVETHSQTIDARIDIHGLRWGHHPHR